MSKALASVLILFLILAFPTDSRAQLPGTPTGIFQITTSTDVTIMTNTVTGQTWQLLFH